MRRGARAGVIFFMAGGERGEQSAPFRTSLPSPAADASPTSVRPSLYSAAQLGAEPVQRHRTRDWFTWEYFMDWAVCLAVIAIMEGPVHYLYPPHEVFYMAGDYSQSYPYQPDTVPSWALGLIMLSPLLVLPFLFYTRKQSPLFKHELHNYLLAWLEACAINYLIAGAVKVLTGRHRPDYFSRLNQPDLSTFQIRNASFSFPSGHTSGSFTAATILFLYLSGKTKAFPRGNFALLLVLGLPFYFALWVLVTRLQDYKHHHIDVVAGVLVGLASGGIGYLLNFPSVFSKKCGTPNNLRERNQPRLLPTYG